MNMRSFVVVLVFIAVVAADVSHLSAYSSKRPTSYDPPPSGSPFDQPNSYYQQQQRQQQQRQQLQQHQSQSPVQLQPQSHIQPHQQPHTTTSHVQYTSRSLDGSLSAPRVDTDYYARQLQLQNSHTPTYQASAARELIPRQTQPYHHQPISHAPQPTYARFQQPQSQQQQQQQPAIHELPPIVTKHFYVHAAPEDPDEKISPTYLPVGRARKTYKVIFIKAPTYESSAKIIPILPQNEEKTVVYVLSKKPDFSQNIQLPEQPVTEPSKPEVYFIKYKTQQEAENARQQIQAAYDNANDVDRNAIQQGAGVIDVRSSTEGQTTAPVNNNQFAVPQYNPVAYQSQSQPQPYTSGTTNFAQQYQSPS